MNLDFFVTRFTHNAEVIGHLVDDVSEVQARWKPAPEEWSVLEVVNHLVDEEREDFRKRLDLILHYPEQAWPSIDPAGWVSERRYNERDLSKSLTNFLEERETSLTWLGNLSDPDWNQVSHRRPRFGSMVAKNMLASWLAHDWLHIRQLNQLQYQYLAQSYQVGYAGDW